MMETIGKDLISGSINEAWTTNHSFSLVTFVYLSAMTLGRHGSQNLHAYGGTLSPSLTDADLIECEPFEWM